MSDWRREYVEDLVKRPEWRERYRGRRGGFMADLGRSEYTRRERMLIDAAMKQHEATGSISPELRESINEIRIKRGGFFFSVSDEERQEHYARKQAGR